MGAPGLDFETWDSTKALVGKYYSPKVAKASPISFHGILGLRKQPIALRECLICLPSVRCPTDFRRVPANAVRRICSYPLGGPQFKNSRLYRKQILR
jgi:hypothetical protein